MSDKFDFWLIEKIAKLMCRLFRLAPHKAVSIGIFANLSFWVAIVLTAFWLMGDMWLPMYIIGAIWWFFFALTLSTCIDE